MAYCFAEATRDCLLQHTVMRTESNALPVEKKIAQGNAALGDRSHLL